jgi:hypothetical protein
MNQIIYQAGLEEFRQFSEETIREALEPYAFQMSGQWKASTILANIEASYARAITLKNGEKGYRAPRGLPSYEKDGSLEEVASHLSEAIDREIYQHFLASEKRPIYILNFRFLKQIILKNMEGFPEER